MQIVLWDPFLMKKLLKSVIYGTREQYTGTLFTMEKSNVVAKKKKKKNKKQNKSRCNFQSNPIGHFVAYTLSIYFFFISF